jgi:hypothetical protein
LISSLSVVVRVELVIQEVEVVEEQFSLAPQSQLHPAHQ